MQMPPTTARISGSAPSAVPESGAGPGWRRMVAPYETPSMAHSLWQVTSTLVPLALALYVMYRSLALSYWVTLLLAVPTAGLVVRTFTIMHDCAHGSLFDKRWANDAVGWFTGVLALTPYVQWRRDHVLHHASSGDLNRRGHGDVWTLTVREYRARSRVGKLRYRLFRHPLVLFGLGPLQLALGQRWRTISTATGRKEQASVRETNLALLALILGFSALIGLGDVAKIYVPVFMIAGAAGIWLFYVQHQFEDTYWAEHEQWDYVTASIHGSSYYKLPAVLNWFTCSIGLHHVHHLSPRIPNYRLRECHAANAQLQEATTIGILESRKSVRLTLWDEDAHRLVGWDALRRPAATATA
ncbi:MAG: fatty acid desaturase [Gemmatimonadaceae bacterium]